MAAALAGHVAGPGGKARLLYGLAARRGARLTAAELHPHRAALVRDALTAAGRNIAGEPPAFEVLVADSTKPPWPADAFDRVLVDVPCSGLGALRRRPEARWRKAESDLAELATLQRALLGSALAAVRPGGVVAYVTCSPVPAETSAVVTDVAAARPGTEVLDATAVLPGIPGVRAANPLFAQLWPHRHGTDAIFIALLRRAQAWSNPVARWPRRVAGPGGRVAAVAGWPGGRVARVAGWPGGPVARTAACRGPGGPDGRLVECPAGFARAGWRSARRSGVGGGAGPIVARLCPHHRDVFREGFRCWEGLVA